MMAPVYDTRTEGAHEECVCRTASWWEHPASLLPNSRKVSLTNRNTTMESDYQYRGSRLCKNTRFGANQDRSPAVGAGLHIDFVVLLFFNYSFCTFWQQ